MFKPSEYREVNPNAAGPVGAGSARCAPAGSAVQPPPITNPPF
ncbi:MAG: hypothetical protein ABFC38_00290 [Methanospirillum sp.]